MALPVTDSLGLVGDFSEEKFRIEKVVAEGGFGIVYLGTHVALETPVAIKALKTPTHLSDRARADFIDTFVMEAKTIARIKHPHIVQVLDTGVVTTRSGDRVPWMALEWLTGQTLRADLASRRGKGGRTPAETMTLMRPILEAIAYAHEEGVAHRDVKPANIMLVPTRKGVFPKVLDFGIARVMEEGETAGSGNTRTGTGLLAFSPRYAAPEQLSGSRTGPWTDVHALGLIVTEVVTGVPAYTSKDQTDLLREIVSETRPTPRKHGFDLGGWEPVISKAVSYRPDERYANAGDFLEALEEALPRATAVPGASNSSIFPSGSTTGQIRTETSADHSLVAAGTAQPVVANLRSTVAPAGRAAASKLLWVGLALAATVGLASVIFMSRSHDNNSSQRVVPTVTSAASAPPVQPAAAPVLAVPVPVVPVVEAPPVAVQAIGEPVGTEATTARIDRAPVARVQAAPVRAPSGHSTGHSRPSGGNNSGAMPVY